MTDVTDLAKAVDHSRAQLADEGMGTGSSRADRPTSFSSADFPVPNGQEEDWRFTPLERVEEFFAADLEGSPAQVEVSGAVSDTVGRDDPRLGTVGEPEDRTGAVAWEAFSEAHVITLPAGQDTDAVVVVHAGTGMNTAHFYIEAEPSATGTVVLEHDGEGLLTEGVEIRAGDDADITIVSVQDAARSARHLSSQRIEVGRNAKVKHIVVTLGGDLVRITTSLSYAGPGGEANLLGAYITDAAEHQEHRLFVDHEPPNCYSRVTYKGALQGQDAHSVWIGDVLIGAKADDTDTYELNRNLVLTEGAKADSVPNLEIENGNIVGAGHASATGRFDEEQLFYLQARGIPEDIARRLVVRGFFAELVEQITVPSVREKLMAAIESELDLATGNAQ
jgi:Fe-S cluster assembly protein SufD